MKKKTILIIDDYEPLLEELVDFLMYEGYNVVSAQNGAEGVQKAIQHNPNLIICDIQMPFMNGHEVFKTLEKIPATSITPFIFLTALAQPSDFREGLKLGVDDYITKPIDLPELAETIKKRLNKYERFTNTQTEKLKALLENPLTGIYIIDKSGFSFVNKKFEELTKYSAAELKKLKFENLISGDTKNFAAEISMCIAGTHKEFKTHKSIITKDKKAVFIDIFGKHTNIKGQNAVIGSIVPIENKQKTNIDTDSDIGLIIEQLIKLDKQDIADEIQNTLELIEFEQTEEQNEIIKTAKISKRELEVLKLICTGKTNTEIAKILFISNRTVDNHRANLLSKTNTKNTAALVAFAFKNKLTEI